MKVTIVFLVLVAVNGIQAWTVLQELTTNPHYSIFMEWLSEGTKGNLNGNTMTVFVPTNEAIQYFLKSHPIQADNNRSLGGIAEHCVVPGHFSLPDREEKQSIPRKNFPKLWICVKNAHIYINNAEVTSSLETSNGYVHELDAVIYPLGQLFTLKEEIDSVEDYSGLSFLLAKATETGDLLHDTAAVFTVFSPNPKAVTDDIKGMNRTQILPVIRNHLIRDRVLFSSPLIGQSTPLPTLQKGAMIIVQVMDSIVYVGSGGYWSMVESVDVSTLNGVIHVINGVLGVTSGVNVYHALGLFGSSIFRKKIMISELTELKNDLMNNAMMFTIFSPQNTAWDNVITATEKIIKRHVITRKMSTDELMKETEVTTLSGEKLAVKNENGRVYLEFDNMRAEVTSTDNMASNGNIHIIDKVLMLTGSSSVNIPNNTFLYIYCGYMLTILVTLAVVQIVYRKRISPAMRPVMRCWDSIRL